jgi:hypothetical protein
MYQRPPYKNQAAMRRFRFHILVLSMMTLVSSAWAGEDKTEPRLRLELDLVDGSHIIGAPVIESVSVQTSYRLKSPAHM